MMHTSPEHGDTLDEISPDVQQQPVYPTITPTATADDLPDDGDDDNG